MNITTATPTEIDTVIAELDWQAAKIEARLIGTQNSIRRMRRPATEAQLLAVKELTAELEAARSLIEPYDEEFARRGGWTRFFMVTNNGGHLHSSTHCTTCRPTTQFGWMPQYSGSNQEEIVDMAGEDACTICFPDAPVGQRSRLPFRVEEREAADKARAEREEKRTKAAAAQIVIGGEVFKTRRAVENVISRELETIVSRRFQEAFDAAHRVHLDNLAAEDKGTVLALVAGLAEAGVEQAELDAMVAKKWATKVKEFRKHGWNIPEGATF